MKCAKNILEPAAENTGIGPAMRKVCWRASPPVLLSGLPSKSSGSLKIAASSSS